MYNITERKDSYRCAHRYICLGYENILRRYECVIYPKWNEKVSDSVGASPKNPAAVLYSVFYALCDGKSYTVKKVESGYQYSGKTDYGVFTLYQKDDNSLDKLILPDKDISVEFN